MKKLSSRNYLFKIEFFEKMIKTFNNSSNRSCNSKY